MKPSERVLKNQGDGGMYTSLFLDDYKVAKILDELEERITKLEQDLRLANSKG